MPKKPISYKKNVIYKIVCLDINIPNFYIGHTTHFVKRRAHHKRTCNTENIKTKLRNSCKLYNFIRDNGGWENWTMIEIEKYSCNDKNEAVARERYWYELLKPDLNCVIPC